MKHLKQKLYATLAMLMVATTMLATSTYAWFAISTAPEVTTITTVMESTGSLEIAMGTDWDTAPDATALGDADETNPDVTWGARVTSATHSEGLQFPVTVDATEEAFYVPEYDDDGRPATDLIAADVDDAYEYAAGLANITADIALGTASTATYTIASATLLWLRSNVAADDVTALFDGTITLYDGTDEIDTSDADYTGITEDDIGVAVILDDSIVELTTEDALADGVVIGELVANTATTVEVVVYLKGDNITNAAMGEDVTIEIGKITFSSADVDAVNTDNTSHSTGD